MSWKVYGLNFLFLKIWMRWQPPHEWLDFFFLLIIFFNFIFNIMLFFLDIIYKYWVIIDIIFRFHLIGYF